MVVYIIVIITDGGVSSMEHVLPAKVKSSSRIPTDSISKNAVNVNELLRLLGAV